MTKIGFLFAGQGAQKVGMGKELAENFESALSLYEQAKTILDFDIDDTISNGTNLNDTRYTQPAMFLASSMIYQAVIASGITPHAVAGLSLGEYGALYASGCLSFADGLELVNKRAKIMSSAVLKGVGAMVAVIGKTGDEISDLIAQSKCLVYIANYNCPGQVVVGGLSEQVKQFSAFLKEQKVRAISLNVSGPFHTPLLSQASIDLAVELTSVKLEQPRIAFWENVTGAQENDNEQIRKLLAKQVSSPVKFEQTLNSMYNEGITTFVEIGPGKVLSGFVKKTLPNCRVFNVEDMNSLQNLLVSIKE